MEEPEARKDGVKEMNCPRCGKRGKLRVIDTRTTPENQVKRERVCYGCGHYFTTMELTLVVLARQTRR